MIRRIIILAVIILPTIAQGQAITLDNLIQIEKLSISEINNFLLTRNWVFVHTQDSNEGDKTSSWKFYEDGDANSILASIDIIYQNGGKLKIIYYKVANTGIYQQIVKTALSYKMVLTGESSKENSMISIYEGVKYSLMINVTSQQSNNAYEFTLTSIETLISRGVSKPKPTYLSLTECLAITKMNFEGLKTFFSSKHFTYESDDTFHVHPDDKANEYKIFGFISNEKCRDTNADCYFTFLKSTIWRNVKSKVTTVDGFVFMSNDLSYLERLKTQATKMKMTLTSTSKVDSRHPRRLKLIHAVFDQSIGSPIL